MDSFIGVIMIFGFNFPPNGWALCNGQLMPILQNEALFSLIGTIYGGDGVTTFGLPNLQSRVPVGQGTLQGGQTYTVGQQGGLENVTLTTNQLPAHTHTATASSAESNSTDPAGHLWAAQPALMQYNGTPNTAMHGSAIGVTGTSLPHSNIVPFLAVNYAISLNGIYPSRN